MHKYKQHSFTTSLLWHVQISPQLISLSAPVTKHMDWMSCDTHIAIQQCYHNYGIFHCTHIATFNGIILLCSAVYKYKISLL